MQGEKARVTFVGGDVLPGLELAYNVRTPEEVAPVLDAAAAAGGTVVRAAARAEWALRSRVFYEGIGT